MYVDKKLCGRIVYVPRLKYYTVTCDGAEGSVVKITNEHNYLSLAEVQVFGKILSTLYYIAWLQFDVKS